MFAVEPFHEGIYCRIRGGKAATTGNHIITRLETSLVSSSTSRRTQQRLCSQRIGPNRWPGNPVVGLGDFDTGSRVVEADWR